MGTIADKLQYTKDSVDKIGASIKVKNPTFDNTKPLGEWSAKVDEIDTTIWQPHKDWWDVKKILADDNTINPATSQPFKFKWIELIRDSYGSSTTDTITFSNSTGFKFSDNPTVYVPFRTSYTFDKSKDKICSDGYSNRYIIHFSDIELKIIKSSLILHFVSAYTITINFTFQYNAILEAVEFLDGNTFDLTSYAYFYYTCISLQLVPPKIITDRTLSISNMYTLARLLSKASDMTDMSTARDMTSLFQTSNIREFPKFDGILKPTSISSAFNTASIMQVLSISAIDTSLATDINGLFYINSICRYEPVLDVASTTMDFPALFYSSFGMEYVNIKNLGSSLWRLSECPHLKKECLVYLLENAKTVVGKTIQIGATNIAKLTPEEISVGTAKGFTII